jgi:hypothetical protein
VVERPQAVLPEYLTHFEPEKMAERMIVEQFCKKSTMKKIFCPW